MLNMLASHFYTLNLIYHQKESTHFSEREAASLMMNYPLPFLK